MILVVIVLISVLGYTDKEYRVIYNCTGQRQLCHKESKELYVYIIT